MTSSIRCGHVRRIDHFRKYTFATYGVYGVEGDYELDGVWMWRGLEIPEEWKEHQCYEYFIFTKMDPKNEVDQALAEEYWLNTTEGQLVEGRPVYDTSWFK
jgi:elongation factor 1-gamma